MDTDINDIWDLPVEEIIPNGDQPSSSSTPASNHPLFLPSDDDDDAPAPTTNAGPKGNGNPDIDALFEGLDDMDDSIQELAPALDLDALRREADARNTRAVRAEMAAIIPTAALSADATANKTNGKKGGGPLDGVDGEGDADEDGKKKRKPIAKLDETRLLGKNGFLQLVKDTKHFKPKGKGHEATDLDRVLQVYQFWTHRLYPKTRFKETVDRVEKLCHSKRMQVALSVWRDEAQGLVNGIRLPPPDNNNDDSDADSDADGAQRNDEGRTAAEVAAGAADQEEVSSSRPSLARSRMRSGSGVSATSDSEGDSNGLLLTSDASHPPPSSPERDEAAGELDALLEEEGALRTAPIAHAWKAPSGGDAAAMDEDEDEDLWDMMDTGASTAVAAIQTATTPAPPAMDDDEDMWDIVNEIEQDRAKEAARQPNPVQEPPPPPVASAQVDDYDDLYL